MRAANETHALKMNIIVIMNNSPMLRESPTSVFKLYFHSLEFLKALLLMLLLSLISNKEELFVVSTNKVAVEEVP